MLLERVRARARRALLDPLAKRRDRLSLTYTVAHCPPPRPLLPRQLFTIRPDRLAGLSTACALYLEHRFDLLGSDWVEVTPGREFPGLEGIRFSPTLPRAVNASNADRAREIRKLISPAYRPIDWHVDFRTGYRWREDEWFGDIHVLGPRGSDIKLPWELARMQHLPQLAIWAAAQPAQLKRAATELQDEVLDFIAANPPRYGVNWRCTMDVGIRAANWLVAWNILVEAGAKFDAGFVDVFAASLHDHGKFIRSHLERSLVARGNHYLANLAGLIFIAAFLPADEQTRAWLDFATVEFYAEVRRQFFADGGNFEASTCYHRLSAEMAAWSVIVLRAAGIQPPSVVEERLAAMSAFLDDCVKPSKRLIQLGDNDSGRFLNLQPLFHGKTQDQLDALATLDTLRIACNTGSAPSREPRAGDERVWQQTDDRIRALMSNGPDRRFVAQANGPLGGLRRFAYADFGLYGFRNAQTYVAVHCGPIGQEGVGGHAHNDQLGVELTLDGKDVFADPGTYLYTALPERRDEYRSVQAHFAPRLGDREPSSLAAGLFALGGDPRAKCMYFGERGFIGVHYGYGEPVFRRLRLMEDGIEIIDFTKDALLDFVLPTSPPFSPAYGVRLQP